MARPSFKHRKSLTLICLGFVVAGLLLQLLALWRHGFVPWQHLEFTVQDFIIRNGTKSPQNPQIVYLAIDYSSVALELDTDDLAASPALMAMKNSGWPWTRDIYAHIIERLADAGAGAVVFDLLFPTPRPGDEALQAALEKYAGHVVIGGNFVDASSGNSALAGSTTYTKPASTIIPPDGHLDSCVGFVNVKPDLDEVVRRVVYRSTLLEFFEYPPLPGAPEFLSLAARALQKSGREDAIPPGHERRMFRFAKEFRPHSVYEIFVPRFWEQNFQNGAFFKNKIVFIGSEGDWAKDTINTPFGEITGVQLHLNAANAALNHDFLLEVPLLLNFTIIAALGALAWLLGGTVQQPLLRLTIFLAVSLAFYTAIQVIYNLTGINQILVVLPLATMDGGGLTFLIWERMIERRERLKMRRTLESYVSKNVVKEILDNPGSYLNTLRGVRQCMVILMTDLRDFTTITESADSNQLVAQLNEYFSEMVRLVFEQKGSLDKFIGDAILAVWGNVHSEGAARDVELAVTTGLRMLESLEKLNTGWRERGIRELEMGIGINFGEAIFGNIGSTEKMEPTVIGDPVNLASRLEGLTKEYGQKLLLGESAAQHVSDRFHLQLVDYVQVKGKTQPINIYAVLGPISELLSPRLRDYLKNYDAALESYRAGKFEQAAELFSICLELRVDDPLATLFVQRCEDLIRNRPADWNGVFVMTRK